MRRRGFACLLAASLVMGSMFGCKKGGDGETTVESNEMTPVVTTAAASSEDDTTASEPKTTLECEEDQTVVSESLDVKKYFEERAEVISVTPVKDSKNTLSEKNVIETFKERGFQDYPITTNYSFDGEYSDSRNASPASSDKHPMYTTYYVTSKNEFWIITSIDGTISATPSSYNLAHYDQVPVEVTESEQVASYDSISNSIYITKPKANVLDVRIVDRIDADTLETIDLEVNDNGEH